MIYSGWWRNEYLRSRTLAQLPSFSLDLATKHTRNISNPLGQRGVDGGGRYRSPPAMPRIVAECFNFVLDGFTRLHRMNRAREVGGRGLSTSPLVLTPLRNWSLVQLSIDTVIQIYDFAVTVPWPLFLPEAADKTVVAELSRATSVCLAQDGLEQQSRPVSVLLPDTPIPRSQLPTIWKTRRGWTPPLPPRNRWCDSKAMARVESSGVFCELALY